jgi:photosystem II stability/assembly factor-like uncharacterized protein
MAARSSSRRRITRALVAGACLACVLASGVAMSNGATTSTVVTVTVPSASWIDTTGCAPNVPGRTSFGSVLPGSSAVTTLDCDVEFGSSNDTASLHTWQTDGNGTAMTRATWTTRTSGTTNDLQDVDATSASTAWVSAQNGMMLRTTNGGANWTIWTNAQTGVGTWLYGVGAVDANITWAVGGSGTIIRTINGGTNWTDQSVGGGQLYDVEALDATNAWAVGQGGRILKTTNAGALWSPQVSTTVENINDVDVVDANVLWAVGFNGVVLKTTDGGATWVARPSPVPGQNNRAIAAIDASTAFLGDSGADVWKTTNGGGSWTRVLDRNGAITNIDALDAPSSQTVFSGALPAGYIDRTSDGGTTWTDESPSATLPGIYAVAAADESSAYAVGAGGVIYTTPSSAVADFANDGTADFDTVGSLNLFGACLRDADLGATGGGGGWIEDTNTGADCADGDGDPWNAIPAGSPGVKIASIAAPDAENGATDPVAHIRFGFRAKADQPPGRYLAPLTFQVVAPAA